MVQARALSAAITGGPGAGKSSLLHELARRGFETRDEVARDILKSPGGMELREQDPLGFAEAMLDAQINAWEGVGSSSGPVIFDRGFPDIVGFLRIEGLSVPTAIDLACRNYRVGGPVFLAGPWREIYHSDEQRIQNWEEAVESYRVVSRVWRDYGYDLIDLPKVNLDDRAQFVIDLL